MSFCPSCGCGVTFHDTMNKIGNEVIAHCENCGPCWRTVGTTFLQDVIRLLAATS